MGAERIPIVPLRQLTSAVSHDVDHHRRLSPLPPMHSNLTVTEIFLIALAIIFTIPYQTWRIAKTDDYALLLMAVASTMLTVPVVTPKLQRLQRIVSQAA